MVGGTCMVTELGRTGVLVGSTEQFRIACRGEIFEVRTTVVPFSSVTCSLNSELSLKVWKSVGIIR